LLSGPLLAICKFRVLTPQRDFNKTIGLRIDENYWEQGIAMAGDENWVDIGATYELSGSPLRRIKATAVNGELAITLKAPATCLAKH
jgi:hypothetical protein